MIVTMKIREAEKVYDYLVRMTFGYSGGRNYGALLEEQLTIFSVMVNFLPETFNQS